MDGELLLKFRPSARGADRAGAMAHLGARKVRSFKGGAEHRKLGAGVAVDQAIERLARNPLVEYAEPNYLLSVDAIPNDPALPQLYGLINSAQSGGTEDADIDAELAWDVSRGSRSVVVAVIDTGVDYTHRDLASNIWTNAGEIAGNGLDDDHNGWVDDVHGYDFDLPPLDRSRS